MKYQAMNPYLPTYEYIPDGEPYVFGDRLYVYGSHDCFNGSAFCMNDYVCWSASTEDLSDWRFEGVIYRKQQDPHYQAGNCMYAPDITPGPDGRYYMYYTLDMVGRMSVAVGDSPVGPFAYYGDVHYADGRIIGLEAGDYYQFDPGVLLDDDGKVYLYSGFGPRKSPEVETRFGGRLIDGAYCMELESDMLTIKAGPTCIVPQAANAAGTEFEAHPFFEASSIRKIKDVYYFVYSSTYCHELCYATSAYPDRDFKAGGVIVSNGDIGLGDWTLERSANYIGNNHGGMAEVKGQWYIFYHRQTNLHSYSRQGCAEPIYFNEDGSISQVEMTSCGLNGKPLSGKGCYRAAIACNLFAKEGASYIDRAARQAELHPYLTQSGGDRESDEDQYIANLRDGSVAGYKYFDLSKTKEIGIEVKGDAGRILVKTELEGEVFACISFGASESYQKVYAPLSGGKEKAALFFCVETKGAIDFAGFEVRG